MSYWRPCRLLSYSIRENRESVSGGGFFQGSKGVGRVRIGGINRVCILFIVEDLALVAILLFWSSLNSTVLDSHIFLNFLNMCFQYQILLVIDQGKL